MPAYNNYPAGAYMCVEGNLPYGSSSAYVQNPCMYGSEVIPPYYWDTAQVTNATHGTASVRGGTDLSLSSDSSTTANVSDERLKRFYHFDSNVARSTNSTEYSSKIYESALYGQRQSSRDSHQVFFSNHVILLLIK